MAASEESQKSGKLWGWCSRNHAKEYGVYVYSTPDGRKVYVTRTTETPKAPKKHFSSDDTKPVGEICECLDRIECGVVRAWKSTNGPPGYAPNRNPTQFDFDELR